MNSGRGGSKTNRNSSLEDEGEAHKKSDCSWKGGHMTDVILLAIVVILSIVFYLQCRKKLPAK